MQINQAVPVVETSNKRKRERFPHACYPQDRRKLPLEHFGARPTDGRLQFAHVQYGAVVPHGMYFRHGYGRFSFAAGAGLHCPGLKLSFRQT